MEKRNQETMSKNFTVLRGDTLTIKATPGQITNNVLVLITNERTNEEFWMCFNNVFETWDMFKTIDESEDRQVLYHLDGQTILPLKESFPYHIRFC